MEKFYFEVPSIERKHEAIEYICEHKSAGSNINGSGSLDKYIDNYEGWLEKLEQDRVRIPDEHRVPAETYFLIREEDNKIVGMINIRLCLNEFLSKFGGHIGYGIKPTERRQGYAKIQLYLTLIEATKLGIDKDTIKEYEKEYNKLKDINNK